MKRFLFIALLSLCGMSVGAQGIKFFHGSYEELLKEAKKQDKKIFIDFYTKWCGPCRAMAKNVFPLKPVGDFYNEHFICYKVDAEVGEGPELSKKYNVKGFPTFTFTDANGKSIHEGTCIGASDQHGFIKLGRLALGLEIKTWEWYEAEFKKGNRDPEFVEAYLNERYKKTRVRSTYEDLWMLYGCYTEEQKWEKRQVELVFNCAKFNPGTENKFYPIVLKNRDKFPLLSDRSEMVDWMLQSYYKCFTDKGVDNDKAKLIAKEFKKQFPKYYKEAYDQFKADRWRFVPDDERQVKEMMKYVKKYGEPSYFGFKTKYSALSAKRISKEHALYLRKFFEKGLNMESPHFVSVAGYIYLTYKAGFKDEAIKLANKHSDLAEQYKTSERTKWSYDVIQQIKKGENPTHKPPFNIE